MKNNQILNYKINKKIEKLKLYLSKKLDYVLANNKYEKFILISHARSGSNLVINAFKSHPHLEVAHEIFAGHNRNIGESFEPILENLFNKKPRSIKAVGCKIFYYHLTNEEWEKISSISDLKVIHLKRKNRLRTITSLKIAFKTDQWGISKKSEGIEKDKKLIRLDFDEVLKKIEEIDSWERQTEERFKNHSLKNIYYEDLAANPHDTIMDLVKFLGINNLEVPIQIKNKKQNLESLEELIENYQELKEKFKNTSWFYYFE
jgi:LPS sulfotransferase NodH